MTQSSRDALVFVTSLNALHSCRDASAAEAADASAAVSRILALQLSVNSLLDLLGL